MLHLSLLEEPRRSRILTFHQDMLPRIARAKGSGHNHQAYEGGYADHIESCLYLAAKMHRELPPLPFGIDSAITVLYFHDIEKLFRGEVFDKDEFLQVRLPAIWDISFSEQEWNALRYVHGEGDDYRKDGRAMNELAAFCHAVDVLSARVYHQGSCVPKPPAAKLGD